MWKISEVKAVLGDFFICINEPHALDLNQFWKSLLCEQYWVLNICVSWQANTWAN